MPRYDEDLSENIFFKALNTEYKDLLRRAVLEKWVICVPQTESLLDYDLNISNVLNHVLVPSQELPETHFQTLCKTQVCINNGVIKLSSADSLYDVLILFTETYYTEDRTKFDVLCVERPIGTSSNSYAVLRNVQSLRNCIDLLLTESSEGAGLLEKLDSAIGNIVAANENFSGLTYRQQLPFFRNLYEQCLDLTLSDSKISRKYTLNKNFFNNVKLSVEAYIQHSIYQMAIRGIVTDMTDEIGEFNKILRSMAEMQIQEIGIEQNVIDTDSLLAARNELSRLDGYSTLLGKYNCLKRSLNGVRRIATTNSSTGDLSSDDLLPITVFLIMKAGLSTWLAQLRYLKEFRLAESSGSSSSSSSSDKYYCYDDDLSFLISTFDAAILYIQSETFYHGCIANRLDRSSNSPDKTDNVVVDRNNVSGICNAYRILSKTGGNPTSRNLFRAIINDDLETVLNLLENEETNIQPSSVIDNIIDYCHPLCSCDRCEKLSQQNVARIDVNSANEAGITAIHVASCCGNSVVADALLQKGANPNAVDFSSGYTALHYAARYGNQSTLLLLMYANSNKLDEVDNDGNTALMLAANNGHEDCVKALLYFAEHVGLSLRVDCVNKDGDTALHQAVRWNFRGITKILLTYNAVPTVKNKYQLSCFDLTQSKLILRSLNDDTYHAINLLNSSQSLSSVTSSRRQSAMAAETMKNNEVDFSDDLKLLPKQEYGVRSHTAASIKKVDKLFKAIKTNDIAAVKFFLGFNDDVVNATASDLIASSSSGGGVKCHPLCRCEQCADDEQQSDIMDDFVIVKDSLNIDICNSEGMTSLHVACLYGKTDIVRFLLDIGVKPNVRTYKQLSTPLHLACQNQHVIIAKMLINTPTCKINLQDADGNSALHYACLTGNGHLAQIIIKIEPDIYLRNKNGKTPLAEAEDNFSFFIVDLLKSKYRESTIDF